jgi:hypothetical protein
MPRPKQPTSFRLTDTARALLQSIAEESGVSVTAALEMLIRDAAKRKGIKP